MTIIRNLRKHPEKLKEMIPDFKALYTDIVTDGYSRSHLDQVVETLRANADKGITTLIKALRRCFIVRLAKTGQVLPAWHY